MSSGLNVRTWSPANGKRQTVHGKRQTANGKQQSQNANLALHFVVRDQHGTKGNLLLVERVLLSSGSKKVSQF